jgi:hypothetical protein
MLRKPAFLASAGRRAGHGASMGSHLQSRVWATNSSREDVTPLLLRALRGTSRGHISNRSPGAEHQGSHLQSRVWPANSSREDATALPLGHRGTHQGSHLQSLPRAGKRGCGRSISGASVGSHLQSRVWAANSSREDGTPLPLGHRGTHQGVTSPIAPQAGKRGM